MTLQSFASDNNAGIAPAALAALTAADAASHVGSYGADRWTEALGARMSALFERDCRAFLVFNGTAANSLSLAHLCRSFNGVICHEASHIATDECGAPEFFSGGAKLLTAATPHAKLTPEAIRQLVRRRTDMHAPKPAALSLTQATEHGTVYTVAEIAALTDIARQHGLRVHMDGARFANAVATLAVAPADLTWRAGVDVLSFGATKNGLPVGEAVVFFDPKVAEDFAWRLKQGGQLASKMRYLAAPWLAHLESGEWLANARHANAMAHRLAEGLSAAGIEILFPVQANAVFATLPKHTQEGLRARGWKFYTFLGATGCRLMCAWDMRPESIDAFVADARALVN